MTTTLMNPGARRREEVKPFMLELLSWDFYEDVYDDRSLGSVSVGSTYKIIPERFNTVEEYVQSIEPLFYEETRAQIERAKQSERGDTEVFDFLSLSIADEKEGLVKLVFNRKTRSNLLQQYSRSDVLLISARQNCLEKEPIHAISFVDDLSNLGQLTCFVKLDISDPPRLVINCSTEFSERSRAFAARLNKEPEWFITKIYSISTAQREFVALKSLASSADPALIDSILNRPPADMQDIDQTTQPAIIHSKPFKLPLALKHKLQEEYNEFQFAAILAACKQSGVTLIQGPPGTGKTTTILGVIASMLSRPLEGTEDDDESDNVKQKSLQELLTESTGDSDAEASPRSMKKSAEALKQRKIARLQMMRGTALRSSQIGHFVAWEDKHALTLETTRNASTIYTTLGHPLEPIRKVYKEGVSLNQLKRGKILVCAPSNAAIDEIVRRLLRDGVYGPDGDKFTPRVVRVGPNMHPSLNEVSFTRLSEQRMAAVSKSAQLGDVSLIDAIRSAILNEADVIASTLSVAGSPDIRGFQGIIDTVIIDEASQGIELATLIPLSMGCKRLVLVGDHKQLPATVFSLTAQEHMYSRSLFQRLQSTGCPMSVLRRQFRMHPIISEFPSKRFYEGKIEDAENILDLVDVKSCRWYEQPLFGPLVFFDVADGAHTKSTTSLINEQEADCAESLVKALVRCYPDENWKEKIAVVTPYAEQVRLIRDRFKYMFGVAEGKPSPIEVNTVDGFQGREKDCIIVSTVRAADNNDSIGFLRDARRMNVTLTRARQNLWIIGNGRTLKNNELWNDFLGFASTHGYAEIKGRSDLLFMNCKISMKQSSNHMDEEDIAEKPELQDIEPEEIE